MTQQEIIEIIDRDGIFNTSPSTSDEDLNIIETMVENGILNTAKNEGISIMNNDWSYIRTGNPDKVCLHYDGAYTWLAKP